MAASLIIALRCPLSGEIMRDPVLLVCSGLSYERRVLETWIADNGTDPESGEPLTDGRVLENRCLRLLIEMVAPNPVV